MISAKIVADSINKQGDRLTTFEITFPRIILPEFNTHRMFSRNTSSSRAIPFIKLVKEVEENPFIPIAWQKDHSGMQGREYFSDDELFNLDDSIKIMQHNLKSMLNTDSREYKTLDNRINDSLELIKRYLQEYKNDKKTLNEWWLNARNKAIEAASLLYVFGVSKQFANRLLEPFVWTKMLVSSSYFGLDNFFNLRCPLYKDSFNNEYKSKNDYKSNINDNVLIPNDKFEWYNINHSQAEIHIQELAEVMYDAYSNNEPMLIKPGGWHIPYEDKMIASILDLREIDASSLAKSKDEFKVKVATALAARVSYTTIGDEKELDYKKLVSLHDKLIEMRHDSPLEHCAKCMDVEDYNNHIKGVIDNDSTSDYNGDIFIPNEAKGWCNNFKGFIPYRFLIENKI